MYVLLNFQRSSRLTVSTGPETLSLLRSLTYNLSHRSRGDTLVSLSSKTEEVSNFPFVRKMWSLILHFV